MRAWQFPPDSDGFDKLYLADLPDPAPGPGEVLIAPKAWSINYRDFAVASGKYFGGVLTEPAIPLSDGAGEVVAVGEGVTAFQPGDRVQGSFFLDWLDGPQAHGPRAGRWQGTGHAGRTGGAARQRRGEDAPTSLSFARGRLHALCRGHRLECADQGRARRWLPGSRVLVLGQRRRVGDRAGSWPRPWGREVIATCSCDEKLARMQRLGADACDQLQAHA